MARATNSPATRKRHRRVLERAKGFRGSRSKLFTQATNVVDRAGVQAYISRRQKKRMMSRLWNLRINAGCRPLGLTYSQFVHGLKLAGTAINRKMIAEVAATDPVGFASLVETAKAALAKVKA